MVRACRRIMSRPWRGTAKLPTRETPTHNTTLVMYALEGVPRTMPGAPGRKAANQGNAFAQLYLGNMYHDGQGVPQDYVEAVAWYRKAADQGDAEAQYNLGVMYENGEGIPQDYAQALTWYRKAADQGNAKRNNNLGVMYENGEGIPQDYAQALTWYRKAADQG